MPLRGMHASGKLLQTKGKELSISLWTQHNTEATAEEAVEAAPLPQELASVNHLSWLPHHASVSGSVEEELSVLSLPPGSPSL